MPGTELGCVRCGGSTGMLLGLHHRTHGEGSLKLYLAHYGTMQEAITRMEADRHQAGSPKYLEFARQVNEHQKVMSLW